MSAQTTRISDAEKKKLQEISRKTGIPLKKLIDLGAQHVISEWQSGKFGVLSE